MELDLDTGFTVQLRDLNVWTEQRPEGVNIPFHTRVWTSQKTDCNNVQTNIKKLIVN